MKDLYAIAGISKQAIHQHEHRRSNLRSVECGVYAQADMLRKAHPRAGCRKMAMELRCKGCGRDKTEKLLLKGGYRVKYRPNYTKTTQQQRQYHYPNLIEGMELNNAHQVVQTDITYYRVKDRFYYLTFFIDVYSRYIGGYAVSKNLKAEANVRALKMLLQNRVYQHSGLIHHSDRGTQFIDNEYLQLIKNNTIRISMCDAAWKNAYAERINRTIKEEYLDGWSINSFEQLKKCTRKAVHHYNENRKHLNLQQKTPKEYELYISRLPADQRVILKLYKQQT